MQTFRVIDTDEAEAEMSEMPSLGILSELPEITEHHALMHDGEGNAVVCAHDTANATSRVFSIPAEFTATFAADDPSPEVFQERVCGHLNRIARAVYN